VPVQCKSVVTSHRTEHRASLHRVPASICSPHARARPRTPSKSVVVASTASTDRTSRHHIRSAPWRCKSIVAPSSGRDGSDPPACGGQASAISVVASMTICPEFEFGTAGPGRSCVHRAGPCSPAPRPRVSMPLRPMGLRVCALVKAMPPPAIGPQLKRGGGWLGDRHG
jgi:hypothetical protein